MKYWQAALWYVAALILQLFMYNLVPKAGITPNLIMCITVVFAFLYEDKLFAVILGALFGIICDICFGQYVGATAFTLAILAAVILVMREFTNIENIITVIVTGIISTWFYYTVLWVIMHFTGSPYGYMMVLKLLPWYIILNVVFIVIIYAILIKRVVKYRRDRLFNE